MRFPYPKWLDVTPVVINITDGLTEDGVPDIISTTPKNARVDESVGSYYDAKGFKKKAAMTIYFEGNIEGEKPLTGSVTVYSVSYEIKTGNRHHNPDGSVCFTELILG